MPFLTFSRIKSIQIVDINSLDEPLLLEESQGKSSIGGERIPWKTWENEIFDLSGPRSQWPDWAKFDGPWGEEIDQVKTTGRPPMGVIAREIMYRILQVGLAAGALNNFIRRKEIAAPGPWCHEEWATLDTDKVCHPCPVPGSPPPDGPSDAAHIDCRGDSEGVIPIPEGAEQLEASQIPLPDTPKF
ncbi:hypothetical protein HK097_010414 [Rhizophlyctis rosea]|uniref:Uncharacterized protein n=1 Tax=Rhizophlyctis rosea TaxID=64517 RepID=A0AAD5SIN2_9FUNG|nr:hypothetical protein HK097_010414 [Rhizophlyctis rosea]